MLLPALNAARESARKASCMSNLKQIGLGIKQYANMMRWEGWYPSDSGKDPNVDAIKCFNLLVKTKKLTDAGMYICPSATGYTKSEATTDPYLGTGNVSYRYTKTPLSESSAADSCVALDVADNHTAAGNALFVDGHVGQFDTIEGGDAWDAKGNVGGSGTLANDFLVPQKTAPAADAD